MPLLSSSKTIVICGWNIRYYQIERRFSEHKKKINDTSCSHHRITFLFSAAPCEKTAVGEVSIDEFRKPPAPFED